MWVGGHHIGLTYGVQDNNGIVADAHAVVVEHVNLRDVVCWHDVRGEDALVGDCDGLAEEDAVLPYFVIGIAVGVEAGCKLDG